MNNPSPVQRLQKQRGQSLVEMGLTLVILLWLLAAAINFGTGYLAYVTIRDAAQEGAVYGALYPTDVGGIVDRVRHSVQVAGPVNMALADVDVTASEGICPGNVIRVMVSYNFQLTIPFVDMMIDNPIPIHAYAASEILRRVDPSCPAYEP